MKSQPNGDKRPFPHARDRKGLYNLRGNRANPEGKKRVINKLIGFEGDIRITSKNKDVLLEQVFNEVKSDAFIDNAILVELGQRWFRLHHGVFHFGNKTCFALQNIQK